MESFWNLPNALRKPKMNIMDHNMSVEIISAAKEATAELELNLTYNIIINNFASAYFIKCKIKRNRRIKQGPLPRTGPTISAQSSRIIANSIGGTTGAERLAWKHPRPCRTCCHKYCRDLWATWERIYGIISPDHRRNHITDKASFVTSTYNHLSVLIHYSVIHVIYTGSMIRTFVYWVFLWCRRCSLHACFTYIFVLYS